MKTSNFTQKELENYFNMNETIFFNYRRVYRLKFSNKRGFFFVEIKDLRFDLDYYFPLKKYVDRGRFIAYTPKSANKLLDKPYFLI